MYRHHFALTENYVVVFNRKLKYIVSFRHCILMVLPVQVDFLFSGFHFPINQIKNFSSVHIKNFDLDLRRVGKIERNGGYIAEWIWIVLS